MGSGKSTIAWGLSKVLHVNSDLDEYIEEKMNLSVSLLSNVVKSILEK
jgi:shikimate kinase